MHLNLIIPLLLLQRLGSEKVTHRSIKCLTFTFCSKLSSDYTATDKALILSLLECPQMESCPVLKQQVATLNVFIYILFGITTGKWNARKWNLLKDYFIQVCGISICVCVCVCVCVHVYKYPSLRVKNKKP